jgi:hypothetical protein
MAFSKRAELSVSRAQNSWMVRLEMRPLVWFYAGKTAGLAFAGREHALANGRGGLGEKIAVSDRCIFHCITTLL